MTEAAAPRPPSLLTRGVRPRRARSPEERSSATCTRSTSRSAACPPNRHQRQTPAGLRPPRAEQESVAAALYKRINRGGALDEPTRGLEGVAEEATAPAATNAINKKTVIAAPATTTTATGAITTNTTTNFTTTDGDDDYNYYPLQIRPFSRFFALI